MRLVYETANFKVIVFGVAPDAKASFRPFGRRGLEIHYFNDGSGLGKVVRKVHATIRGIRR